MENATIIFLPVMQKQIHMPAYEHSGNKCLHRKKSYEEMCVRRLNNASNLYSIRVISKRAG